MHALVGAGAEIAALVQRLQVAREHRHQVRRVLPVAEELLHVEQRVQRRPKLRVDPQRRRVRRRRLGQPRRLAVARAEVLVRLAERRLRRDRTLEHVRRLAVRAALFERRADV
eukprot:3431067-Prymnesium_polylepis.2